MVAADKQKPGSDRSVDPEMVTIRDRVIRLFQFLREYAQIRFPPVRTLDKVKWTLPIRDLPDHRSIFVASIGGEKEGENEGVGREEGNGILMRVERPTLTRPPEPPTDLREWLERKTNGN
ncbi:MAG: hypothetical protein NZ959_02915 [Armatimonadetes bacterium]|nr:hypothetical protein [Armatimonadota bacterium]MDW8121598.1 hypothetical protein [Armatimonadota bacterium]